MNIRYLKHSGVFIETKKVCYLFDYIGGDIPHLEKPLYIFVSHSHPDHYSKDIFKLNGKKFFLSTDIPKLDKDVTWIKPGGHYDEGDFTFHCFGSTDAGVSILLVTEEGNIFFAGDLNDWYWEDEDTDAERRAMRRDFLKEMMKVADFPVNVACFPVDPRLKSQYDAGPYACIQLLHPDAFLPIHFWEDYPLLEKFEKTYGKQTNILRPEKENQDFVV